MTLDALAEAVDDTGSSVAAALLPPAEAAARFLPVLALDTDQAVDLGHGKTVAVEPSAAPPDVPLAAVAPDGRLVGIARVERGSLRSVVNFPPEPAP